MHAPAFRNARHRRLRNAAVIAWGALLCACGAVGGASGAELYVDGTRGLAAFSGLSPEAPLPDLASALAVAEAAGTDGTGNGRAECVIHVAPGIYSGERNRHLQICANAEVAIVSSGSREETVIDLGWGGDFASTAGGSLRLERLTITNGGDAAIRANGGSLVLADCAVTAISASSAPIVASGADIVLQESTFSGNGCGDAGALLLSDNAVCQATACAFRPRLLARGRLQPLVQLDPPLLRDIPLLPEGLSGAEKPPGGALRRQRRGRLPMGLPGPAPRPGQPRPVRHRPRRPHPPFRLRGEPHSPAV